MKIAQDACLETRQMNDLFSNALFKEFSKKREEALMPLFNKRIISCEYLTNQPSVKSTLDEDIYPMLKFNLEDGRSYLFGFQEEALTTPKISILYNDYPDVHDLVKGQTFNFNIPDFYLHRVFREYRPPMLNSKKGDIAQASFVFSGNRIKYSTPHAHMDFRLHVIYDFQVSDKDDEIRYTMVNNVSAFGIHKC